MDSKIAIPFGIALAMGVAAGCAYYAPMPWTVGGFAATTVMVICTIVSWSKR